MERSGDRREPAGRRQHHRRRGGGARRARRLHAAVRQHQRVGQSEPVQIAALRHAQGPRAGRLSVALAQCAAGASEPRRGYAEGPHRARQGKGIKAAQLRHRRPRQRAPFLHGAAEEPGRHRPSARSLSRRRTGGAGGDARRSRSLLQRHSRRAQPAQGRQGRPARHHQHQARADPARTFQASRRPACRTTQRPAMSASW